jgi:porphobilinogen synthase
MKLRLRNTRKTPSLRRLVRETELSPSDFVMPYFVRSGQFQLSIDELVKEARGLAKTGVESVILFGIPDRKDERGSGAYAKGGIVQQAVKALKDAVPELLVITDVCLCEYTDHGHCGLVRGKSVDNDSTLPLLQKTAASHVEAGADIVAPSGMMDGVVGALREALPDATILAYAAKYSSAFYGPFRQAAESAPKFGDRRTYQMDPANADEALREIRLDLEEGADIIMVKPALAYLDVLRRARETFGVPTAAYNVSGEYSMIKAAAERGWIDEKQAVLEVLTSIKRAGAGFILTYFARGAAQWIS